MLKNFFSIENKIKASKGKVLISEPLLDDYYFKKSIIILTEHNSEGSIGFVINNPVDVKITELIPNFPEFNARITIGGPVNTDTLQFLHNLGNKLSGSIPVRPGLFWGGDFGELAMLVNQKEVKKDEILFCLGYSGWSSGQLQSELDRNSWLVTELGSDSILRSPKNLWRETLMNLGEKEKLWANFPNDPELN